MNTEQKNEFLIEELEARLEMSAVVLDDGTVVEGTEADYVQSRSCHLNPDSTNGCIPY